MSTVPKRSRVATIAAVALLALAAGVGVAVALDKSPEVKPAAPDAAPAMKPDDAAMMQMMMELAKPGKPHAMIQKFAGTWNADLKTWMTPDQKEPITSKGVMTCRPMHSGRFLFGEFSGSFMNMPFEGTMLWGYNNALQRFESTWMDSMSTMIMFSTGSGNADLTETNMATTFGVPGPDAKPMTIAQRERFAWINDDKAVMEMWHTHKDMPDAKEMRVMEITYTRVKDPATKK
jgi:hypothetical protein